MRPNARPEDAYPLFGGVEDKCELFYETIDTIFGLVSISSIPAFSKGTFRMKKVQRGEIYFADLGQTEGSEQRGIRPVVIIQNDIGNLHSPTTIVAAITSSQKKTNLPCHVHIALDSIHLGTAKMEQIRTIDKRRLTTFIGKLSKQTMCAIDHALRISLELK